MNYKIKAVVEVRRVQAYQRWTVHLECGHSRVFRQMTKPTLKHLLCFVCQSIEDSGKK